MQATVVKDEIEPAGVNVRVQQRGDSFCVPDEVEDGVVNALRGSAEAMKRAACDGVTERCEHIEDRSIYGCVDWYLYPEGGRKHAGL